MKKEMVHIYFKKYIIRLIKQAGFGALVLLVLGICFQPVQASGLKVAAVFETPIEEPWVNQIHVALLQAKKEMGIEYTWSESVKSADFARVMREYAENGYKLITGDSLWCGANCAKSGP